MKKACALHRWLHQTCPKNCQGRKAFTKEDFSMSFKAKLSEVFKNKKLKDDEKVQEDITLFKNLDQTETIDYNRVCVWGYNLLPEDSPIWEESKFQQQVLKYIRHAGKSFEFNDRL
jgi:hypothetical protein